MDDRTNRNKVNQVIGDAYGVKGVPPSQLPYLIILAVFLFPIFLFDKPFYFMSLVAVFIGWVVVTGKNPARFWEKARNPRNWTYCSPECTVSKAHIPTPRLPKQSFRIHKRKKWHYIEMEHKEFRTFFDFRIDPIPVGAYVLHRKTEAMIIVGWRCRGHDSMAVLQDVQNKLDGMFYGLSGIPGSAMLKIYQSSFLDDGEVPEQYMEMSRRKGLTSLERILLASGIKRVQDMCDPDPLIRAAVGNMQNQEFMVYAKIRLQFGSPLSQNPSGIEKFLTTFSAALGIGITDPNIDHWNKVARSAYEIFTQIDRLLRNSSGFGFDAQVLTAEDLWETDYCELHLRSEVPPIPQKIVVDSNGLGLPEFNTNVHVLGALNDPENGYSPIIQAERSYVYIPTLNKYAGFVRVGGKQKIRSFPSHEGSAEMGLYHFWQNIVSKPGAVLHDYKIVWEFMEDDSSLEIVNLERTIKGAVGKQTAAIRHKTIDVSAQILQEEAMDAREALEGNDKVGWVGVGIWLYRNSPEELFSAMNGLIQSMPTTDSEIATDICDYIWNQTRPYTWQQFLTEPDCRRIKYMARNEVVPQIPFMSPQLLDAKGSLFLDERFRTPVYLDFAFRSPNHIAIIAETKGSKSVFTFGLILERIIYQHPAIIFEFPRADGSSTYTDFLRILKAQGKRVAYIDVRRNRINILERSRLSHINTSTAAGKTKYDAAIEDLQDSQASLLVSVVLGTSEPKNRDTIESWISRSYKAFLADPQIVERYETATAAGFGNPGFALMPGLPDYVEFAGTWFQSKIDEDRLLYDGSRDAIDYIMNSLRGVLDTALGRSISGPSTFSLEDSDCIVLSLTNVSGNRESLVYAEAGLQLIYRKSISSKSSACFVEELTTLYQMPAFARRIASLPPTARKQGMNCAFIFQSIAEPFQTSYGALIFNNLQKVFLLKASEGIVEEVVNHLQFRRDIAQRYIGNTISKEIMESRLCVRSEGMYIPLVHNPSPVLLSLAATDRDEVAARQRCEALYGDPNDPANIDWLIEFSHLYSQALRSGAPMDSILPDVSLAELAIAI
jgi:hypothetical protein